MAGHEPLRSESEEQKRIVIASNIMWFLLCAGEDFSSVRFAGMSRRFVFEKLIGSSMCVGGFF